MTPSQRLAATYNLNGILIHRPTSGPLGRTVTGEAVKVFCESDPITATGYELAESIALAKKHVALWQEAIDNMQRVLDEAEPYVAPAKTAAPFGYEPREAEA